MHINKLPYSIEDKGFPDFDKRMQAIALKTKVHYINHNTIENTYQWLDEVHLDEKSVEVFSEVVAKDILSHQVIKKLWQTLDQRIIFRK